MKIGSYNYVGKYDYNVQGKPVQKKSKAYGIFLKTVTRPFKFAIFPAASPFLRLNKKRLAESRKDLQNIGGKQLKLRSPDKTTIDAMYLSADKFKAKLEKYFDVMRDQNTDKQYLVLKEEFIDPSKEFSEDSFEHIVEGEARDFCKTLSKLDLGLEKKGEHPTIKKDAVIIPLRESHFVSQDDDEAKKNQPAPAVLICSGRSMSFPGYKGVAAAYLLHGLDVMLFDYPGVGRSKGSPTDYNTKLATDTCFQFLKEKKGKEKVLAHGHSLGTAFALDLAARRKGVHAVVDRGFSSFRKVVADKKPRIHKVVGRVIPKIANFNNKANLKNVEGDILIIRGGKDTVIPHSHADRNFAAAQKHIRPGQNIEQVDAEEAEHSGSVMSQIPESFDEFLENAGLNRGLFQPS